MYVPAVPSARTRPKLTLRNVESRGQIVLQRAANEPLVLEITYGDVLPAA